MPIEIRELHIRVAINAPPPAGHGTGPATPSASAGGATGGATTQDIVAECVEQVLQLLHNRKER